MDQVGKIGECIDRYVFNTCILQSTYNKEQVFSKKFNLETTKILRHYCKFEFTMFSHESLD